MSDLDFVINYEAFKKGEIDVVKNEFISCTKLAVDNGKVAKWIIEIAALTDAQIAEITSLIRILSEENFPNNLSTIFVKSSTGFYTTEGGKPNGATPEGIKIMLDHAGSLPVKAAGGVKSPQDAVNMIKMGVQRIGTSSAIALVGKNEARNESY